MENNKRKAAIYWWNNLSVDEQKELVSTKNIDLITGRLIESFYNSYVNTFKNRKTTDLLSKSCKMQVIQNDYLYVGMWYPFKKENYTVENMPSEGYLGTFRFEAPQGEYQYLMPKSMNSYGFHAWKQNDFEFILFKIIN